MIKSNETFCVPTISTVGKQTFVNPMGDEGHPDPCIVYCEKEGCYYGISTSGECFWGTNRLVLHRSAKFEDMFVNSESRLIYESNEEDDTYRYLCTSPVIGGIQMLAVQELKSPAEPIGEMAIIAKAELPWELVPPYQGGNAIVEGGYFVKSPNGRLYIFYSANGCWSDDYAIGLLEYKGGNMASEDAWGKYPIPVVNKGNGVFGPGHATFFYSPDKSELWICHHSLEGSNPGSEPMNRRCHCQRVFFDETGFPHIGDPIFCNIPYPVPSGSQGY